MDPVTGLMIVFFATLTDTTDLKFQFECPVELQLSWNATSQTVTCGNFKLDTSKNKCTPVITSDNIHLNCEFSGAMKITYPGGISSTKILNSTISSGKKMYQYQCDDALIIAPVNLRLVPRSDK